MNTKREIGSWQISTLKVNPLQDEFFGPIGEELLTQLMADLAKFGQRVPIEITADGTILDGHQRVEAARRLDWSEVDVVVVEGTPAELEERFLTANAVRRQLSPLQRVRCAARLMEIQRGKPKLRFQADKQRGQLRDLVGKLLGISGRAVDRLLRVLKAPPSVQGAYDAGKISIGLAGKVAELNDDQRKQLDEQLQADKNLDHTKQILEQFISCAKKPADRITGAYRRYLATLQKRAPELKHVDSIAMDPRTVSSQIETLSQANELNAKLLKRARKVKDDAERQKREFDEQLIELRKAVGKCA